MKTAIILISLLLASPAWHYGKQALSWICANPTAWTAQLGYLPWFLVVSVTSLLIHRKRLEK